MRKRFERIASLISAIVTGIETLVLIAIIIGQALLLERSNRAQLLEIGLNASILLVSLVTFMLSIFALKRAKGDYLSAYKNRRLIYAVMAFDYLLAFLFFTYCLIEKNILVVVLECFGGGFICSMSNTLNDCRLALSIRGQSIFQKQKRWKFN